jgi:hypothetical protein
MHLLKLARVGQHSGRKCVELGHDLFGLIRGEWLQRIGNLVLFDQVC